MTTTPFLSLNLRNKKDAVLARQRARRVANVLAFDAQEQACIAAGTFIIACQALMIFGRAKLCFQIENHQLGISAQESRVDDHPETHPISRRLVGIFPEADAKALFRLVKSLPAAPVAPIAGRIGISDEASEIARGMAEKPAARRDRLQDEAERSHRARLAIINKALKKDGA